MKIVVIGSTGTIGQAVVSELAKRHTIITVGHTKGDICVDIADNNSIKQMYKTIGKIDAVIATTGRVNFMPFLQMKSQDYEFGLHNKLMGQVNLVLEGIPYMNENGSFTLTSGILSHDPIRTGSSASMVNGAIDAFVKSAAIEMPKGIRINSVSPTIVTESMVKYGIYFHGFVPVSAALVALAFSKSVEGAQTGQIYQVG